MEDVMKWVQGFMVTALPFFALGRGFVPRAAPGAVVPFGGP